MGESAGDARVPEPEMGLSPILRRPSAAELACTEELEHADLAAAVTLASLPQMTPVRLRRLLGHHHDPDAEHPSPGRSAAAVLDALQTRSLKAVLAPLRCSATEAPRWSEWARTWQTAARHADARSWSERLATRAITAVRLGHPGYPAALERDPEAPCLLFLSGRLGTPDGLENLLSCRVAIVGTRSATHYGLEVASELGASLARASVTVISGLAVGIDAAAHHGALLAVEQGRSPRAADDQGRATPVAPPLGIAGGGVDVVYPRRNARLWREVLDSGAILSEAPPGARPEQWRFPLRNRILAALAEVVVVVESHAAGGSMHTVEAALHRGVPVLAVPGPVHSAASAGTNALLAEGAEIARGVEDVLVALSLRRATESTFSPTVGSGRASSLPAMSSARPVPGSLGAGAWTVASHLTLEAGSARAQPRDGDVVLESLEAVTTSLERVVTRTGLSIAAATIALDELVDNGRARRVQGGWVVVTR